MLLLWNSSLERKAGLTEPSLTWPAATQQVQRVMGPKPGSGVLQTTGPSSALSERQPTRVLAGIRNMLSSWVTREGREDPISIEGSVLLGHLLGG